MGSFFIQRLGYQLFATEITRFPENENKPTLVFLHDSWGCTEMWGDFPERLVSESGLNGLVYDRRGYGQSSPFDITQRTELYLHDEVHELMEVLDACDIQQAVLYGHSDGATIALLAAALYPERIKGLILEGAHSFIEDSGKAAVLETRERARETSLLASLEKYHGDKTSELFRLWHETWLSDYFAQWTIVPLLHNITCPVLAFQGEHDEFGSIEQLNILKKEIPAAVTIAEIATAGHTPRKEAEEETMKWVRAFLVGRR
ncbi:MAG: alpha/beta hydrolase [Paludibacter sp.]|nr:alpha/beta hydrolase [Paludibacter sp.]